MAAREQRRGRRSPWSFTAAAAAAAAAAASVTAPALKYGLRLPPSTFVEAAFVTAGDARKPVSVLPGLQCSRGQMLVCRATVQPYLSHIETRYLKEKPEKDWSKRRTKRWKYSREDGWVLLNPPKPPELLGKETIPSEDPGKLLEQIKSSRLMKQLLAFLPAAMYSSAFSAIHVAQVLDTITFQRCSLKESPEFMQQQEVLTQFAARGLELMESADDIYPDKLAKALRGLAIYREQAPQLLCLVKPFADIISRKHEEMDSKELAMIVTAVSFLHEQLPWTVDAVLPPFLAEMRLERARYYLKQKVPQSFKELKFALIKLQREVPYLREILTVW